MRKLAICWIVILFGCNRSAEPAPTLPQPAGAPVQAVPTKPVENESSTPIRFSIATFNVHFANREWKDTVAVIQSADADLICLQESSPEMEAFLADRLTGSHPHSFFSGPGGISVADRFAFFSRYPLHSPERIPRSEGLFDSWVVQMNLSGRFIQVISVHLQPAIFVEGIGPLEALKQIEAADATHTAELRDVLGKLDPSLPSLIVGDFNSLASAGGLKPLITAGLKDAVAETNDSPETQTTWEWPTPWGKGAIRIDHLWYNQFIDAESTTIFPAQGSDHRLVVGRFRLNDE